MNTIGLLLIALFLILGVGLYYFLRTSLKWPSKNNPLFFLLIFAPSFIIIFSPFASHLFSQALFALSGGLFLSDSVYHRHQEKQRIKQENLKHKQNALNKKQKDSANKTKNAR